MHSFVAYITGPRGSAILLDLLAADLTHARELAREHGATLYGRRGFSFCVRSAA